MFIHTEERIPKMREEFLSNFPSYSTKFTFSPFIITHTYGMLVETTLTHYPTWDQINCWDLFCTLLVDLANDNAVADSSMLMTTFRTRASADFHTSIENGIQGGILYEFQHYTNCASQIHPWIRTLEHWSSLNSKSVA